jgi:hypothetical protein
VERRWISLTSGRNPRSSIRTSARTCFFRFNLKTKHVDFIHSFACQCHVYYTKYYNATCNAVNTHLFKTASNLLGEIGKYEAAGRDTGTTILVIPVFYQYLPVSAILVQILVNTNIPVSSRIIQYLQY